MRLLSLEGFDPGAHHTHKAEDIPLKADCDNHVPVEEIRDIHKLVADIRQIQKPVVNHDWELQGSLVVVLGIPVVVVLGIPVVAVQGKGMLRCWEVVADILVVSAQGRGMLHLEVVVALGIQGDAEHRVAAMEHRGVAHEQEVAVECHTQGGAAVLSFHNQMLALQAAGCHSHALVLAVAQFHV
eukprot:CAMPEP_0180581328 /NCGR_PEP_ID=MMETSP1037_2-20121125/13993_1 /TAXON_ID=632150 /ORGANISM="Azadinium spinosum, Strain 3D9" /LENGTH=183 /DNA_ID=CAMNT_0022599303 /DNA_START=168 /DNA_END=716 /DNA_ORIENTATION=-